MFVVRAIKYDKYGDVDDERSYKFRNEKDALDGFERIVLKYLEVNELDKEKFVDMDGNSFKKMMSNQYATLASNIKYLDSQDISNYGVGEFIIVEIIEYYEHENDPIDDDIILSQFLQINEEDYDDSDG